MLLSIISAWHEGEWTLAEVQDTLQMLFDRQYTLTETVVTETRYDAEGDPYTWYICCVTLESENLPTACLHHGRGTASRYALLHGDAGKPSRSVPRLRLCGNTQAILWSMKSLRNI